MKKLAVFFLLSAILFPSLAQQPQLVQERNYKVEGFEKEIYTSAVNQQGNILYSGSTLVGPYSFINTFLLIQPNADTLWTRNGPTDLKLPYQALKGTSDGGFIFAATAQNPAVASSYGILLQKLSANAVPTWTQNSFFNNTGNAPTSLLVMPDDGFLIGGKVVGEDFSFFRTDKFGNHRWLKKYDRSIQDVTGDIQFTEKSDIIAYGQTSEPVAPWHLKLLLLNQNGDSLNGKQLIVTGSNRQEGIKLNFNSITPISDGGFLLTAYTDTVTSSYPNGINMGMVVKVDSSFNIKWHYVHRTATTDEYVFTKAKELTDGTILVLGFKMRPAQGGNGFQIYRFNPSGQLKNVYPFTSSICSQVWGITFDALADSTFMIGGRCGNSNPNSYGFYVAKVKVPGLPPVVPPFIISGNKEEAVLTGTTLGQSYPNPTNLEATIPYSLQKNYDKASILIREITTGKELRKYDLKRNSSSLTVNVSYLSNGLYLYSLEIDEKPVATRKLAVMK